MSNHYIKNIHDLKVECLEHMASNGLPLSDELICDGYIHRYAFDGIRDKPEWYRASHITSSRGYDYLNCTYGSWRKQVTYKYNSFDKQGFEDTQDRRDFFEKLRLDREKEAHQWVEMHNKIALEANKIYNEASLTPPDSRYDAYITVKGVKSFGDVRYGLNPHEYPSLIIPLRSVEGNIRTLQFISYNPESRKTYKTFLTGGEKRGNFFLSHEPEENGTIYIAEGYSTAASVYEVTGKTTAVAFDAGNLLYVGENIKKKYPTCTIIIAGDDDADKTPNVGKEKAYAAAKRVGCSVVFPLFPEEKSRDSNDKRYTDFNDLHQVCGLRETRKQLMNFETPESEQSRILRHIQKYRGGIDPCAGWCVEDLPGGLREFVQAVGRTTNAHPIMVASSALCTVSAFVGKRMYVAQGDRRTGFWQKTFANLWVLNVAGSGQYKSTAMEHALKIVEDRASECYAEEARLKNELKQIRGKKDEDYEKRQEIEDKIIAIKRANPKIAAKITAESFLYELGLGCQGVVRCGEFKSWLDNMGKKYNLDLKSTLTDLYDVPRNWPYVTKSESIILQEPFFSVCAGTTLPWLKKSLDEGDVESGFFARTLLFAPPKVQTEETFLPPEVEGVSGKHFGKFANEIDLILISIGSERRYKISPEAELIGDIVCKDIRAIADFYEDKPLGEKIIPFTNRWKPSLLKISMICQLFIDPDTDIISFDAIVAAAKMLSCSVNSTLMLFKGDLGETAFQGKKRKVFQYIITRVGKGETVTYGKLIKSGVLDGPNKDDGKSNDYAEVLKILIDSGEINEVNGNATNKKLVSYIPVFEEE